MVGKSDISFNTDAEVRESALDILRRMGIDEGAAMNMFYRKVIAIQALPFQPEPLPSAGEQLCETLIKKIRRHPFN